MIKVLENGFIEVDITSEMLEKAKLLQDENTVDTKNTLMRDVGGLIGNIGEVVFHTVFPKSCRANTFHYDFIWNRETIDIKTKTCTSIPKFEYDNSIFKYQKQNCDKYVFIRITQDYKKAWIVGMISKENFYKEANLMKKGEIDPRNNFKFLADKYNLPISKLKQIGDMYAL